MDYYFISPNAMLIECVINPSGGNTQQKNKFGTNEQLLNRKIIAIEALSSQDVAFSPISTANPVIPPPVWNNSFLSLYTSAVLGQKEGLYYDQIPLSSLRPTYNPTTGFFANSGTMQRFCIRPYEIAWQKSYISIPATVAITQAYSALFVVHYLDQGDLGMRYDDRWAFDHSTGLFINKMNGVKFSPATGGIVK